MNRILGRRACLLQTRPLFQRQLSTVSVLHSANPCHSAASNSKPKHASSKNQSPLSLAFWTSLPTWRRASLNTFRCLIGCTSGDFASLWILQSVCPDLGMGVIMGISMTTGLLTSISLETILLHHGRDRLPWMGSLRTAVGMSFVSMLAMEAVQNVVDYHLTGGVVAVSDPWFWIKAGVAMGAGFLGPLPYNYLRLRRYGVGCH